MCIIFVTPKKFDFSECENDGRRECYEMIFFYHNFRLSRGNGDVNFEMCYGDNLVVLTRKRLMASREDQFYGDSSVTLGN